MILAAILLAGPVAGAAQSFPQPPDVAPYAPVPPTWAAGTIANRPLDARVSPPRQQGLADIPGTQEGRIANRGMILLPLAIHGGTSQEAKFRTHANVFKILFDDPIRNFGQPGASHCHEFFGNRDVNANSTFASLRTDNASTAAGADLNATGYWFPCPVVANAFGDGRDYAVQANYVVIYYQEDPEPAMASPYLPLGLRYVTGFDMDDPDMAWLQAYVDAANAQRGTPRNRYRVRNPSTGQSSASHRWSCPGATPALSDWLRNADGSDPFGGTCAGGEIFMQVSGARCWDGVNLWSPGGYRHVIPAIWDSYYSKFVCPTNYYQIPALQLNISFQQRGFADYGRWRLDSDDHAAAAAGRPIRNGESFHTDWMNGWDEATLRSWMENCIGVMGHVGHACDYSTIGPNQRLILNEAAPDGRSPQVNARPNRFPTDDPANMFLIPSRSNGPTTLHVHGSE
jgi:hypothetical protein